MFQREVSLWECSLAVPPLSPQHSFLFFFDFFSKYQLYSWGSQCLMKKSPILVLNSFSFLDPVSVEITFLCHSLMGKGKRRWAEEGRGTNWCLDSITIVSKIGWAKFTKENSENRQRIQNWSKYNQNKFSTYFWSVQVKSSNSGGHCCSLEPGIWA